MKTLFLILMISFTLPAIGQQKTEIEKRIDRKEAPADAQKWLEEAYAGKKKTRWYFEQGTDGKSYEAKLKWGSELHSVQFTPDGSIQDIEVLIDWEDVPVTIRERITRYLDSTYVKHGIQKVQRQWTGSPEALRMAVETESMQGLVTRYEVEYYGKTESVDELWEGLFDSTGALVQKRRIQLRPVDNLQY